MPRPDGVEEVVVQQGRLFGEAVCQHLPSGDKSDLLDRMIVVNGLPDTDDVCLESVIIAGFEVVDAAPQGFDCR